MSTESRCMVSKLPPGRMLTNNALEVWSTHHTIHGLVEVDISTARRLLLERRSASGESLSMTAFVIHCLAVAVSREPRLNSLVRGARRYTFDTVNVATMVEREIDGEKVVAGVVIRAAEAKTVGEIHEEIRRAQTQPVESVGDMGRMRWLGPPHYSEHRHAHHRGDWEAAGAGGRPGRGARSPLPDGELRSRRRRRSSGGSVHVGASGPAERRGRPRLR